MGSRRTWIGGGVLGAVLIAGLCAALWHGHTVPHRPADARQPLSVGAYLGEFSSLLWVAESEGLLTANGLDVRVDQYDSGVTPVRKLLAGEVEVATAAEFVAVNYIFEHPELRILGTIALAQAIEVVARREAGVEKPADLRQKRIGLKKRSQAEFFLSVFLSAHRISLEDVVVVDVDPADMASALGAGDVDAVVVWHPFAHQLATTLGQNAAVWDVQLGQTFFFLLITRESTLSSRPDAIGRFLEAMVQAAAYVRDHGEECRTVVRQRLGSEEPYSRAIWNKISFEVTLPQTLLMVMEDEAGWMIQHKLTRADEIPNYLDNVAIAPLADAKPEGVTIFR